MGGDLSAGATTTVAVTVLGECPEGRGAAQRSGARRRLLVSGPLGAGRGGPAPPAAGAPLERRLVRRTGAPWPRLAEGWPRAGRGARDDGLSDGVALDLHRLADASNVGFALDDLPVADGATLEEAIGGGEDYELLIATNDAPDCHGLSATGLRAPLTIGVVERRPGAFGRTTGEPLATPGLTEHRPRARRRVGEREGLVTLPARRHPVQTLTRLGVPFTSARTRWMFGFQRRLVRRCEW